MKLKQYDIYWANLDPTIGNEIRKTRPVLIVSPDSMNATFNRVIICPLTTSLHPKWATRVQCTCSRKPSEIAIDQIRAIDAQRLYKKIQGAAPSTIAEVRNVIRLLLL